MVIWTDLLDFWMLALLVLGLILFFGKPMLRYGFPRPLELAIVALCLMIYLFHFAVVVIIPTFKDQQTIGKPCMPTTLEAQCYNLSQNDCTTIWGDFDKICRKESQENLDPSRLTSLAGASIKSCIYKKFDHGFKSTRRFTSEGEPCYKHFKKLDAPSP